MIKVILWDVDGTLLNFLAAEEAAIRECFARFNLGTCTDEMLAAYSAINKKYWKRLEDGELTKPEVLVGRFQEFFSAYGLDVAVAPAFNAEYQVRLGDTIVFCDDAYNLVSDLRSQVKQYAVTNGTKVAQDRKLSKSGLDQLFDGIFISDVLGVEKPSVEFFEKVFTAIGGVGTEDEAVAAGGQAVCEAGREAVEVVAAAGQKATEAMDAGSAAAGTAEAAVIGSEAAATAAVPPAYKPEEVLIVGDSLNSDIRGGNNAGILCGWYNPAGDALPEGIRVDYDIRSLQEIRQIVR